MAVQNMNHEEFTRHIQGETPVLAEFMAPWCIHCRRIGPAFRQIATAYGDALLAGQVNIDREPGLAELAQIEVVPTFVLYRRGKTLASIAVPDSVAKLDAFIREHLN